MKFLRIKYNNYRCFKDLELKFDTSNVQNISLIVAPNGGGKTEMLFSFWWVLYDFNFKDLKGKEDTPYSLNSALYRELQDSEIGQQYTCSVELDFEHNDCIYTMNRSETFSKYKLGIVQLENVSLSSVDSHGQRSLPEHDKDIVEKRLTEILPKSILYGILFDGERMKQLSSVDELSKTAVEGVIKHITNEELFELCRTEYKDLEYKVSKEVKKEAKKNKNGSLEEIMNKLDELSNAMTIDVPALEAKKERRRTVQLELDRISSELKKNESSKQFEIKRNELKKTLDNKNKKLEAAADEFYKNLNEGYFLISKKLLNDVKSFNEQKDIPFGLTVSAVKSILLRDKCICGHDLTEVEKEHLEKLIDSLPPDNISSTINENIRQSEMHVSDVKSVIGMSYNAIKDLSKEIEDIKKDIAYASTQITIGASDLIKDLEAQYREFVIEENKLKEDISNLETTIETNKGLITTLTKDKDNCQGVAEEIDFLNRKYNFIQKCIKALDEIDEYNKKISLDSINQKINEAYSIISEDYSLGRRLYIVQFDKTNKYRLVSYYQNVFNSFYEKAVNDGEINALKELNKSQNEINEYVILKSLESNSTGQSKINTLAFAKAILDYSNEIRSEESTEIRKDYPFLIDSPFTELTDENLEKSAGNLHKFSSQVILMASNESLSSVIDSIRPFVGSEIHLTKSDNESISKMEVE